MKTQLLKWMALCSILPACGGPAIQEEPKADVEKILEARWHASLPDGTASEVTLYDFLGSPILVYAFTSYCADCLTELPELLELSGESDFLLLPLCLDEEPDLAAFSTAMGANSILLFANEDERQGKSVFGPIQSVPTAFLIGCQGEVLEIYHGQIPVQHLFIRAQCEENLSE